MEIVQPTKIMMDEIVPHHLWVYNSGWWFRSQQARAPSTWLARTNLKIRSRLIANASNLTEQQIQQELRDNIRIQNSIHPSRVNNTNPTRVEFFNIDSQRWEYLNSF